MSPLDTSPLTPAAALDQPRAARNTYAARTIVRGAVGLALLADALFYDFGPIGFALPLWIGALVGITVSMTWAADRSISREAGLWLGAAALFASAVAWRDAEVLQFFNFVAMLASLGLAAIALNDTRLGILAARFRDTVWAALSLARTMAFGILPVALRDAFPAEAREHVRPTLQPVLRAVAITVPLVIVFGALLLSADPLFASLAPSINLERVLSHLFVVGFFAWVVCGWAAGALLGRRTWRAPDGLPFTLGTLDVTIALGTLNVLFAAYVLSQFGWLFGGEDFLRARTGLTVANYARTGFFELVWTAVLVVPMLVGSRAALGPARETARRHTALAVPMIGLVIAILFSAAARLRLYVQYFGLTTDRFYPAVFMAWIAVVLVWLAITVLRGWGRPFVAGATVSGMATLALLNFVNPDVLIARLNLGRASTAPTTAAADGPSVDLAYLTHLSGDAVGLAADATVSPSRGEPGSAIRVADDSARCAAATRLIDNWAPTSWRANRYERPASWRAASMGERAGLRAVAARTPALRAVKRATCPAGRTVQR